MTQWLSLTALDTLFFRGPERFDAQAGGGSYLSSLFPPHPGTVFAALNSALLNGTGVVPDPAFDHEDGSRARSGHHTSRGPWLLNADGEVLLPAPLALVTDEQGQVHALRPSAHPFQTDLGDGVRLPEAPAGALNIKTLENNWLTVAAYQGWLAGEVREIVKRVRNEDLWCTERHTGLERDPTTHAAVEGHLYSAAHIRPKPKVRLLVNLPDVADDGPWGGAPHLPLGGEGRAVWVDPLPAPVTMPLAADLLPSSDGKLRYTLSLITPGLGAAWGVSPGQSVREGVPGTIVCCALARPLRIGGFDTQMRMPERVRSARAAGSVWWMQADVSQRDAILQLHNTCIGAANSQGYGHVMVGTWAE